MWTFCSQDISCLILLVFFRLCVLILDWQSQKGEGGDQVRSQIISDWIAQKSITYWQNRYSLYFVQEGHIMLKSPQQNYIYLNVSFVFSLTSYHNNHINITVVSNSCYQKSWNWRKWPFFAENVFWRAPIRNPPKINRRNCLEPYIVADRSEVSQSAQFELVREGVVCVRVCSCAPPRAKLLPDARRSRRGKPPLNRFVQRHHPKPHSVKSDYLVR